MHGSIFKLQITCFLITVCRIKFKVTDAVNHSHQTESSIKGSRYKLWKNKCTVTKKRVLSGNTYVHLFIGDLQRLLAGTGNKKQLQIGSGYFIYSFIYCMSPYQFGY